MSGQGDVPTIETARLRLRAYVPADFTACAALWADPLVTRYITGKPLTGEEVWARLLRHAGHWQWFGFGYWALEEKSSGLFIGELGFVDYKREIKPSITGTPELGLLACRQRAWKRLRNGGFARRRGMGRRAVRKGADGLYSEPGERRVFASCREVRIQRVFEEQV